MKLIKYILFAFIIAVNVSCEKEAESLISTDWQDHVKIVSQNLNINNLIIPYYNVKGKNSYIKEVILKNKIVVDYGSVQIEKVETMIRYEEKNDTGYEAAKIIKYEENVELTSKNEFDVVFSGDKIEEALKSTIKRQSQNIDWNEDQIVIQYIITNIDDTKKDYTKISDIQLGDIGFGQKAVLQEIILHYFIGEFEYKVLQTGSGSPKDVPQEGTITITPVDKNNVLNFMNGPFIVSDAEFGQSHYGGPEQATLRCEDDHLISDMGWDFWYLDEVDGENITVLVMNWDTMWYDVWIEVEITRTDGKEWPSTLTGDTPWWDPRK